MVAVARVWVSLTSQRETTSGVVNSENHFAKQSFPLIFQFTSFYYL